MNKNFFNHRHPLVTSSYYIALLLIVLSTTNPMIICGNFIASLCNHLIQFKGEKRSLSFRFIFFFIILITITNPLFVHRGGTILFFLFHKPYTLEAVIYGLQMGLMIATVLFLFQNLQLAVDSEKFFYLFGKRLPKLSLIINLVFRFIPLFKDYYFELTQVQKTLKRAQHTTFKEKADYGLDLFGNFFSWALENSMDTADSMRARGYGTGRRTSRVFYRWTFFDSLCFLGLIVLLFMFFISLSKGIYFYQYYPYTENLLLGLTANGLNYLVLFLFALLPAINSIREEIVWHILKSKI